MEKLDENRKIIVNMGGKELREGINELKILADYEDKNGKKDSTQESFAIKLVNVGFFQNIILNVNYFFNSMFG